MPKNIEPTPKKIVSKTRVSSNPSLPENKKTVDIASWLRKDTHEDPRINSLMRIVRWQGRFIVLLILALSVAIAIPALNIEIEIPNQEPLQTAPPLEIKDIDYNAIIFQNGQQLNHGSTVNKSGITIFGQLYDGNEVMQKWPNTIFLVNNASVPITGPNSQFKIDINLTRGSNIIETAVRINGILYNRQQKVINYEPSVVPTSTSTNNPNDIVSN
ncbi:MAG: hypothetical protein P1P90_05510 [Patescibacteria group bacterium]|nr:hypothetical protein [Patescibacteria group bacterium]